MRNLTTKMNPFSFCVATVILGICVLIVNTSDLSVETYCEGTGWVPYRDEKCLKLIKDFKTRDQAREVCAQEWIQSDSSTPQLVSIKSIQEQEFLTEFLFDSSVIEVNVWIGAKRASGNEFVWDDGSEVEYANWDRESPTEDNRRGCVVIQSEYGRKFANSTKSRRATSKGKWRDVICGQALYFLCQKMQRWSFGKLQQALLETRKQLVDSNEAMSAELGDTKSQLVSTQNELSVTKTGLRATQNDLSATKSELSATNTDLSATKNELIATKTELINLNQTIIPIGFIYTQLPGYGAPTQIWPWMTWEDVSSSYAGVFFRVTGGDAGPIGQVQDDNAPRVTKVAIELVHPKAGGSGERDLLKNSWSRVIQTGNNNMAASSMSYLDMKLFTSGGEVRPRNMAIQIWRRTG